VKQLQAFTNPKTNLPIVSHFINGELTLGTSQKTSPIYNPSAGEIIAETALGTVSDVDAAVQAAKSSFHPWQNVSALKRARYFFELKSLLEKNKEKLAAIISREHGKVLSDALGEVQRGIEVIEYACAAPQLLKGDFSHSISTGIDCYDMRKPLGVCVGITPFNFPAMVGMWMFPLALACGNTFILKPSEKDPSVSLLLAQLVKEAGFPDGVFNIVQGDKVVVDALLTHPDVAAVSFVGSTPIAHYIYETASKHGKRVQALGGAKNHCVVMPDADLKSAVSGIMGAAYGSAGERCMAISVAVVVGEETANKLIAGLKEEISKLHIGASDDHASEMGPLITAEHRANVVRLIESGIKQKADLVVDGRHVMVKGHEKGFFLGASLFDHVKPEMEIYQKEIFGPVLCVVRVKTLDEAVNLINQNPYANGAAIYTQSGSAARYYAAKIDAGMVGINIPIPVPLAFHTFGGNKNSMFGGHHMYGEEAIRFYTRLQTITARWDLPEVAKKQHFVMPTM